MTRLILLAAGAVVFWLVWSNDAAATGLCRVQLPYVAPATPGFDRALVRVLNDEAQPMTVQVTGYDDTGRRFGPQSLSVAAQQAVSLTSATLESGNAGFGGLGDGAGWWRLMLTGERPFRAGMYYRTADRFLTELSAPVAGEQEGSGSWRYDVGFFNPGSNTAKVSMLRLANPADSAAEVVIAGRDDRGQAAPGGTVTVTLPAQGAVTLTARMLENGAIGLTGRLGDGEGKWRLEVTADRPLQVMSLLHATQTGHITNLSTVADPLPTYTPPSPGTAPDLAVDVSPVDGVRGLQQGFTLYATVRNSGDAASAAATLRWYRSADDTITTADTPVGVGAIARIQAGRSASASLSLTAPSIAGTYRYGACVDPVCEESDTTNNCSAAVPVRVVGPAPDLKIGIVNVSVSRNPRPPRDFSRETGTVSWVAWVKNIGAVDNHVTTLRLDAGAGGQDHTIIGPIPADPPSPQRPHEPTTCMCYNSSYAPFLLPARGGTGQICVGPIVDEWNTGNNCMRFTVREGGAGSSVVCPLDRQNLC